MNLLNKIFQLCIRASIQMPDKMSMKKNRNEAIVDKVIEKCRAAADQSHNQMSIHPPRQVDRGSP